MLSSRDHSFGIYGRNGTTRTSYFHRQTFLICVRICSRSNPHTHHRPKCVGVNPVIVAQPTTFRRHFNLKKADWEGFSGDFDSNIEEVDAIPKKYKRFVEMLRMAPKITYQEGVSQTTFLVSQTNQRAYMKHTRNSIQLTLLAKRPLIPETH